MITGLLPARLKFFTGLGIVISLIYYSASRQQQLAGFELALLSAFTLAALLFDYWKTGQLLALASAREKACGCTHDAAIRYALRRLLKHPYLFALAGTELLALYYAFLAKFDDTHAVGAKNQFSYANSSNAHDVFLFVAFSQLPFLPFIHILIESKKGPGPAWVVTLLTLWSVIWFLAQVEAVKFRPIELTEKHLIYRYGLVWAADIPLSDIKSARTIDAAETLDGNKQFMSPLGSTRNVILKFERPIQFAGPYFIRRREQAAAIAVDNPTQFVSELAKRGIVADQATQRTLI